MSLKHKLLAKNRKLLKTIDIDGETVEIRKPTMGDKIRVLEESRAAGEINEKNEPANERAGLLLGARVAACLLFDPESGQRIFGETDLKEIVEASWLEEHLDDLQKLFSPDPEKTRGNLSATPS